VSTPFISWIFLTSQSQPMLKFGDAVEEFGRLDWPNQLRSLFRLVWKLGCQKARSHYIKLSMRILQLVALLPVFLLAACAHRHESSASASADQIKAHLITQLHCQTLDLAAEGKNRFLGEGKNDTGRFKITVTRERGKIAFQGEYIEPAHGAFSGSASWSKSSNSFLGFHKFRDSWQDSISAQP
jgi:hypothetical protein